MQNPGLIFLIVCCLCLGIMREKMHSKWEKYTLSSKESDGIIYQAGTSLALPKSGEKTKRSKLQAMNNEMLE